MFPKKNTSQQELETFMEKEMEARNDLKSIISKMKTEGTYEDDYALLYETVFNSILEEAKSEKYADNTILVSLFSGALAAVVGALLWVLITVLTDTEIGYAAIGMGALVSYGILIFTKNKKGPAVQTIGIVYSILGVLIGKYLSIFYIARSYINDEYEGTLSYFDIFNPGFLEMITELLPQLLSGYDALWLLLAVLTSYSMLKRKNIDVEKLRK